MHEKWGHSDLYSFDIKMIVKNNAIIHLWRFSPFTIIVPDNAFCNQERVIMARV